MPKYIFLDTWVLSELTKSNTGSQLIDFLKRNNYVGLITSLSMVELYNPGWEADPKNDRTVRAVNFLCEIPCVIVDPKKVFRAELKSCPNTLKSLPIEIDLQTLSHAQRAQTLLRLMRRDKLFLNQGKDIKVWAEEYRNIKNSWLQNAKNIIEHAHDSTVLRRDEEGRFTNLEHTKEHFLLTLDLRHTNSVEEKDEVFAKIIAAKTRDSLFNLKAIRMTSLCFWYSYVDVDPANKPPYKPSDIGDYWHIGLVSYCAAFTIDKPMLKLLQRFTEQQLLERCKLLTKADLTKHLYS